jgi:hypothetical protein
MFMTIESIPNEKKVAFFIIGDNIKIASVVMTDEEYKDKLKIEEAINTLLFSLFKSNNDILKMLENTKEAIILNKNLNSIEVYDFLLERVNYYLDYINDKIENKIDPLKNSVDKKN